jgi:hypothetical protein
MPGDSMGGSMGGGYTGGGDSNQGGDSGDGDGDDNDDDGSDSMPKDAPLTTGTLTAGGDSDDDDDDDSGGNRGDDNDNDNDNKPTSKDSPQPTNTISANKPECPKGQEYRLFSAKCEYIYSDFAPSNPNCPPTPAPDSTTDSKIIPNSFFEMHSSNNIKRALAAEEVANEYPRSVLHLHDGFYDSAADQGSQLHQVQTTPGTASIPSNDCPPCIKQPAKHYEPPADALPYRGNEVELINSYDQHDIDAVKKYDQNGQYGRFTFTDGTIKEGTYVKGEAYVEGELKDSTALEDIRIKPGPGTPLDALGVKEARLPFSGSYPEVHYKDGNIVTRENLFPSSDGHYGERITTMDSKGNVLETTTIDEDSKETSILNPIDDSYSVYKADGNYIKTWPKKADGSQQFYDSKQQKVFVRDANGNIR